MCLAPTQREPGLHSLTHLQSEEPAPDEAPEEPTALELRLSGEERV